MLQFPYAVNPNNSQAVDGTKDNDFTCIISGTICTAYQVSILNNNTNTEVYNSQKQLITAYNLQEIKMRIPANSFQNGNDLIWKMRLWSNKPDMPVVSGSTLDGSSTTQIKVRNYSQVKVGHYIVINGETRVINGYSDGTITVDALSSSPQTNTSFKIISDFIDTPYYFFKSRTAPEISITNFQSSITDRKYQFLGSYRQNENIAVQYYIFNLYSGDSLIDTTGQIFSADFRYEFDGFASGQEYGIEFICMNQDFVEVTTGIKKFSVSYQAPNIDSAPTIEVLCDKDAVSVSWNAGNQSIPETIGDYRIIENFPFIGTNSVELDSGAQITYKEISEVPIYIDETNFTVLMSTNFDDAFSGKIISLSGDSAEYYVSLEGNTFYYGKGQEKTEIGYAYDRIEFLLQPEISAEQDVGYFWMDEKTWNDGYYFVEASTKISQNQYKITINPDSASVERVGS